MSSVASLDYSGLFLAFSRSAQETRLIFYHILNLDCCVTNAGPYICLIFSSAWKKFDFPYVQHSNLSVCGLFFSSDGLGETKTPQLHAVPSAKGRGLIAPTFGGTQVLPQDNCRPEISGFQAWLSWGEEERRGRSQRRRWNKTGFAHCCQWFCPCLCEDCNSHDL